MNRYYSYFILTSPKNIELRFYIIHNILHIKPHHELTSAPIGVWKTNSQPFYIIMTDRLTDRPTCLSIFRDRWTDWVVGKFHF